MTKAPQIDKLCPNCGGVSIAPGSRVGDVPVIDPGICDDCGVFSETRPDRRYRVDIPGGFMVTYQNAANGFYGLPRILLWRDLANCKFQRPSDVDSPKHEADVLALFGGALPTEAPGVKAYYSRLWGRPWREGT